MPGPLTLRSGRRHWHSGSAPCASGWRSPLQGKGPNLGLEPTVSRVTLLARERKRRATRSAAQPGRSAVPH